MKNLKFLAILDKLTEELTLQGWILVNLKIWKNDKKPDANINNPVLWVCRLPANSLGIGWLVSYGLVALSFAINYFEEFCGKYWDFTGLKILFEKGTRLNF